MLTRSLIGVAALLFIASSAASAADGVAVYSAQCAKCHGESGKADTAIGKAMKVAALAGDANIQKMSVSDVTARIKSNPKHPPTIKSLSDDDVNAVAAHVKQIAGP